MGHGERGSTECGVHGVPAAGTALLAPALGDRLQRGADLPACVPSHGRARCASSAAPQHPEPFLGVWAGKSGSLATLLPCHGAACRSSPVLLEIAGHSQCPCRVR